MGIQSHALTHTRLEGSRQTLWDWQSEVESGNAGAAASAMQWASSEDTQEGMCKPGYPACGCASASSCQIGVHIQPTVRGS